MTEPGNPVKKPNRWMEHVKAVKELHPDMTYKLILQEAKKTYTQLKEMDQPDEPVVKPKTRRKKTPDPCKKEKPKK